MEKSNSPERRVHSKNWSLSAEAKMLFIKEAIEWLKLFIDNRKSNASTGKHYLDVENRAMQIATQNFEKFQKEYAELLVEYKTERPYEEYMQRYFDSLNLEKEP